MLPQSATPAPAWCFLSNAMHGEDEAANQRLLHKVAAALQSGGRVGIKDHIAISLLSRAD
jgi:hypothetical protein